MTALSRSIGIASIVLFGLVIGCVDSPVASLTPRDARFGLTASGPTVTSTLPSEAVRDTTLDVTITGSGFGRGSTVQFQLHGAADARMRVNTTTYVKSTQLVANLTIAADAVTDLYDVIVTTSDGKKGIGTELFAVTLRAQELANGTHAFAVNGSGNIVGRAASTVTCTSQVLPILWREDGTRVELPLGTFCGGTALGINSSGVILGSLSGGASNARGLWSPGNGTFALQEIAPTADGIRPITNGGLNDAGEIVGWRQGTPGLYWWSAATSWVPMQLPTGATLCVVRDGINNTGQIVAKCSIGGGAYDAFFWQNHDAAPILLPKPAGSGDASANDINDAGVIVGVVAGKAARWLSSANGYTLELLTDVGYGSSAFAITTDGSIAGMVWRTPNTGRPALWSAAGKLTVLGLLSGSNTGDALGAANTAAGLVVSGTSSGRATRWVVEGLP